MQVHKINKNMEPMKKRKITETASKKGKEKKAASALSYANRQPVEAQTKPKIKYIFVHVIFMHKHTVLKNLISTGTTIQMSIFCL